MANRKTKSRKAKDAGLSRSELLQCMQLLHGRLAGQHKFIQAVQSAIILPMPHPFGTVLQNLVGQHVSQLETIRDCLAAWGEVSNG